MEMITGDYCYNDINQCGLMISYGNMGLGKHWLK